jgi:hypothetical protein
MNGQKIEFNRGKVKSILVIIVTYLLVTILEKAVGPNILI